MAEIPVFYSEASLRHKPQFEIFRGQKEPHAETVERVSSILEALRNSGFANINTTSVNGLPWVEQVHDSAYLNFLKKNSSDIDKIVGDNELAPGEERAIYPSAFPYNSSLRATNPIAERGRYMFDTYTPIMSGTYDVALESAACAVAGAELLEQGAPLAYALSRPPGHHADKDKMGGYCYINNVAVAVEHLKGSGAERVAVFDFDLHHGNGTQGIFYDRSDVLYTSLHASPEIKFPFFTGYDDERGDGKGAGANHNFPLPEGISDDEYDKYVKKALGLVADFKPDFLVVSAGFDTHRDDPIGAFNLTTNYYQQLGRAIRDLKIPALSVQEGGYATKVLGTNVTAYLDGLLNR